MSLAQPIVDNPLTTFQTPTPAPIAPIFHPITPSPSVLASISDPDHSALERAVDILLELSHALPCLNHQVLLLPFQFWVKNRGGVGQTKQSLRHHNAMPVEIERTLLSLRT